MGLPKWLTRTGRIVATPVTLPITLVKKGVQKSMQEVIKGLLRHLITTFGGGLIASGALSGDDVQQLVGALSTVLGIVLSVLSNRKKQP